MKIENKVSGLLKDKTDPWTVLQLQRADVIKCAIVI